VDVSQYEEWGIDPDDVDARLVEDEARAFHSSYFEMLGEQGYPGLILWLMIHVGGLWRMELLRRRYSKSKKQDEQWVAPLAIALQNGHVIFLVGAMFVGIAYQPFVYMLVALQIGLDTYMARRSAEARQLPIAKNLTGGAQPNTLPQSRRPFAN